MPKFVMSDGRQFTDYNPACSLNDAIQKQNNIKNSHEYRRFLQTNAERLIKDIPQTLEKCSICPVCQKALDTK